MNKILPIIIGVAFWYIIISWILDDGSEIFKCNSIRYSDQVQPIYIEVGNGEFSYGTTTSPSFKGNVLSSNGAEIIAMYYFEGKNYRQKFTYLYNSKKLYLQEFERGPISQQEFYCE